MLIILSNIMHSFAICEMFSSKWLNISMWLIDETQTVAATLGQVDLVVIVIHIPLRSRTGYSQSDAM